MEQMVDKIDEDLLNAAIELATKEGSGAPTDVYHPDFGWVLVGGELTETSQAYYEWLMKITNK